MDKNIISGAGFSRQTLKRRAKIEEQNKLSGKNKIITSTQFEDASIVSKKQCDSELVKQIEAPESSDMNSTDSETDDEIDKSDDSMFNNIFMQDESHDELANIEILILKWAID